MNRTDTLAVLRALGLEPKKSLGQNFMIEPNAIKRIAEAADIEPSDTVLEVGPGLGALTRLLAEQARRVVAVELDDRFLAYLNGEFHQMDHVSIVHGDILRQTISDLLGEDAADYLAVANLPYYITSAVIRHLLESDPSPRRLVVTVQREVAERICESPPNMSILAISVQFYGTPTLVTRLSAANFHPRPKVESAILRIDTYPDGPPLLQEDIKGFFRMVKAGFSQSRKQVKKPLAGGLRIPVDSVVDSLAAVDIDPKRRAETISLDEWVDLYRALKDNI